MLTRDFSEALRVGAQGMVDDITANHGRPWGFPLHEIEAEVHFWICELDRSVPPAMGRYLSKTVPNAETTFVSGAGHLWILLHLHEVLTAMRFGAPTGARSISASG
jgi:pimeloyl-ACP methyl ester carboxylesterase